MTELNTASELLARIDAVVPELQAHAQREDEIRELGDETIECLDELGVFHISSPLEYGGTAFGTREQRRVYSSVARISGSVGWVTWVCTTHMRMVALFSREAQDEVYGMHWRGPRVAGVFRETGPGRIRAVEGGWMLSGTWPFCSGSAHTAWFMLGARRTDDGPARDAFLLLVPRADVERVDDWHVSGLKATGSSTMRIADEVFVPAHRSISLIAAILGIGVVEPPPVQPLFRTDVSSFNGLTSGGVAIGMGRGAIDYFTGRMTSRGITFTDYKVQAEAPITHFQLAEATQRIDLAELALDTAAAEVDRLATVGGELDVVSRAKFRFDLACATRAVAETVDVLHRASGASTIHDANPMQRYARDARVATIHGAANYETAAEDYGRLLAGQPMFNPFG